MAPITQSDGHDGPWLGLESVPGIAAVIDGARLLRVMAWARRQLAVSDGPQLAAERLLRDANLVFIHWQRSMIRQRITPCTAGIGPFSTIAASAARCSSLSRDGWPGALRSISPPGPCALNRRTQSRTTCSVTPPAR